jgi:hypothetical protein
MANNKQPDYRTPNPLAEDKYQGLLDFTETLPSHTEGLYSLSADDVKGFKKVSQDEIDYVIDVVKAMKSASNGVASNVKVENIEKARLGSTQFSELGAVFTKWGLIFTRNAMQCDSYAYQHAATFEMDVESAIRSGIKGAVETKETLESNRKKRNAAAAATRQANAAQKEAERLALEAQKAAQKGG